MYWSVVVERERPGGGWEAWFTTQKGDAFLFDDGTGKARVKAHDAWVVFGGEPVEKHAWVDEETQPVLGTLDRLHVDVIPVP